MAPLPVSNEWLNRISALEEEVHELRVRLDEGEKWRERMESWLQNHCNYPNEPDEEYEEDPENLYDEQDDGSPIDMMNKSKTRMNNFTTPINIQGRTLNGSSFSNSNEHKRKFSSPSINDEEEYGFGNPAEALELDDDELGSSSSKRSKVSFSKGIQNDVRSYIRNKPDSTLIFEPEDSGHLESIEMLWTNDVKVEDISVNVEPSHVNLPPEENEGDGEEDVEWEISHTDDENEDEGHDNGDGDLGVDEEQEYYDDDEVNFRVVGYEDQNDADVGTATSNSTTVSTNQVQPIPSSGPSRFSLPEDSLTKSPASSALTASQIVKNMQLQSRAQRQLQQQQQQLLVLKPVPATTTLILGSGTNSTTSFTLVPSTSKSTIAPSIETLNIAKLVNTVAGLGNSPSPQQSRLQSNLTHVKNLQRQDEIKSSSQDPSGKSYCTFCTKGFNTPAEMTRHMRIHTGEKPYKCYICDYCSSFNGDLVRHLKTRHPGNDPYVCHLCNFTSPDLVNFQFHRRNAGHGGKPSGPR